MNDREIYMRKFWAETAKAFKDVFSYSDMIKMGLEKYAIDGGRMTAKELAECAGTIPKHDTVPKVRAAIRGLIKKGMPIGSDSRGYFLITNQEEFENTLGSLQSRCDALQERIIDITKSYHAIRNNRHMDTDLLLKDRCRYYVIYLAETTCIPYQAVWSMAYRKLQRATGIDLVNLPEWYQGSTLNYISNIRLEDKLYAVLSELERVLV